MPIWEVVRGGGMVSCHGVLSDWRCHLRICPGVLPGRSCPLFFFSNASLGSCQGVGGNINIINTKKIMPSNVNFLLFVSCKYLIPPPVYDHKKSWTYHTKALYFGFLRILSLQMQLLVYQKFWHEHYVLGYSPDDPRREERLPELHWS